jgi:hypothetical protein
MKYAAARAGVVDEGMRRWAEGGEALLVERRGSDVLVVEGAPADRTERMRHWVWRFRSAQR